MRSLRLTLRFLAGALLFVTTWLLWPQELDGFTPGRNGKLSVPEYAMTNARYVSVREGKVEMESRAKDSYYDLGERRMVSKNVRTLLYNADGAPTKVDADETTFLQDDRKVLLAGNVHTESPDGFVLEAPRADYALDKRFLVIPQPLAGRNADGSMRVWANRAESNLDSRRLLLLGDARAQFKEPKRGLTKIRGDRAEVDRESETIQFLNNVRTEQRNLVGTSHQADVHYAPKEKDLKYMSLVDDVVIREQGGRYTRSQLAEFFAPTDTVVLSGFPAVYNGDDAVTGDRITMYRTTGVVEVTQTNAAASQTSFQKNAPPKRPLTKEDEELIP